VAAAVLIVGLIAVRLLGRAPAAPGPSWLGSEGLHLLAPRDEVTSFERFVWTYAGDAASYTLRIYDARAAEHAPPLLEIERWRETAWQPTTKELEQLSGRIVWEVEALDEFGSIRSSERASAWLSSR